MFWLIKYSYELTYRIPIYMPAHNDFQNQKKYLKEDLAFSLEFQDRHLT